ncbi:MAG: bromoperoxidase, partial [Nitrospiraceae bacterium]
MKNRRQASHDVRVSAAALAFGRGDVQQHSNGDESRYRRSDDTSPPGTSLHGAPSYAANYTKCMPHDTETGLLINPRDYEDWVKAADSGDAKDLVSLRIGPAVSGSVIMGAGTYQLQAAVDPAQPHTLPSIAWEGPQATLAGASVRGWESQGAGLTYDLEGPDAQSVSMPPAPAFASQELISEMAELYWMAYLRDVPFHDFDTDSEVAKASQSMSHLNWFVEHNTLTKLEKAAFTQSDLLSTSQARRRVLTDGKGIDIPLQKLFRGVAPGDEVGPYLSQFLLIGNRDIQPRISPPAHKIEDGYGAYGSIRFNQRVRIATPHKNYMINWEDWLDVQNGANVRLTETYADGWRFIATPRDLCTWVHYDALYEAYLNACLLL